MKRLGFVLAALVLIAAPAFADVTVTMSVSISGPMAADGTMVGKFKGTKARSDVKIMGQDGSIFIDATSKQQWMVNHITRQIEPLNPSQALAGLPMSFGEAKVSVAPNGQTKEILGRTCRGFTVEVTMPMTIGGETLTMKLVGPTWLAKDGPGIAEFRAIQKVFADDGLSISPLGQGPQAKAMAEMNKALADAGVALEQEIHVTMEGTGQLAQMMGQMGNMTMTMKVTSMSTDPIPDAEFALPDGYTKK
jgi:hypothetical protein